MTRAQKSAAAPAPGGRIEDPRQAEVPGTEPVAQPEAESVEPVAPPDPFDPASMRIDPDEELVAIEHVLVRLPVRKPNAQEFFRVHPDQNYRLDTALILLKEEREIYYPNPALRSVLGDEMQPYRLYLVQNRGGGTFWWPVRLIGPDGKPNGWWDSAHKAAALAMREWVRMKAQEGSSEYRISIARVKLPEPQWPEQSPKELLKLAFNDYYIDNVDHAVVRKLWGMV